MANPPMNPPNDRVPDATSRQSAPLESWKEIAAYLGKGVTTVRRWEREEGLPVRRQEHIKRGSVVAYKSELDEWRRTRTTEIEPATTRRNLSRGVLITVMAVGAVVAGARWNSLKKWEPSTELLQLTAYTTSAGSVSLAPDGERFSFAMNGRVFVKEVRAEPAREVYKHPDAGVCCVRWSPDGSQIAISHTDTASVWRISLIDPNGRVLRHLGPGGPEMAWRQDGKALLYAHRPAGEATSAIFEHELSTSRVRQVSFPPAGSWGDIAVSVEEPGQRLALARYSRVARGDVYLSEYGGREATRLTHLESWIVGLDWLPHGWGIVFGGIVDGHQGLHRVAADRSGPPTLISDTAGVNRYPDAVSTGTGSIRIGFVHEIWNPNLRLLDRRSGTTALVADSRQPEENPDIGAEGQLAFVSSRTGAENVWVCPPGCQALRRVTDFKERQFDLTPRWSPDGRQIALAAATGGHVQLMVMGAHGEESRVLSKDSGEARPSWSVDGRFLYFQSDRTGRPEIWRIPVSGVEPAVQITRNGGVEAFESPDGTGIFFIRTSEAATLYRQPVAGGAETPVTGMSKVDLGNWRPAGNTVLHWAQVKPDYTKLHEFNLAAGQTREIQTDSEGTPVQGLSVNLRGQIVWSERGSVIRDLQAVDLTFPPFWKSF